jgi:hypothetical protein
VDDDRREIRNVYDDLRVMIEIGIENTLLIGTVVRVRDGISGGRLVGVMVGWEAWITNVIVYRLELRAWNVCKSRDTEGPEC